MNETKSRFDTQQMLEQAEAAEGAGFTAAALELRTKADRLRRMVLAYEFFKVVKQEHVDGFNARLKASTERPATKNGVFGSYVTHIADQLVFAALETYAKLPPVDVLAAVKSARERQIFDSMEVASVEPVATQVRHPDPIVFGRIEGCPDRFFIAQWDNDVSITDLVGVNGG